MNPSLGETRRKLAALWPPGGRAGLMALALGALAAGQAAAQCTTANTVTANVVALDRTIFYNRLGAHDPTGMMYALRGDVVPVSGTALSAGNVQLRAGKRPRPITLRVQQGGCLTVNFTNYLSPSAKSNQPGTRAASVHVTGMQLVGSIASDGSNVGNNATSLVEPGYSKTYQFFAEKEGTYLLYSTAQTTGGDGDGGQLWKGLFGAVNVEPVGSEWYRSQVTAEDMRLAQRKDAYGNPVFTPGQQPVINYDAVYPTGHALAGRPILKMTSAANEIVHADLTAIITGPTKGRFTSGTIPPVTVNRDRLKPFREMTIIFHDEAGLVQAFDKYYEDPKFEHTLHSGRDAFAINYGTGGIGSEVLANRFGVGPMWDCNDCKLEEFFLSSWAVGDPAMIVDKPADTDANGDGIPDPGKKATMAFFPDDPSNVYHSYMNDHLKIRNLHAGPKEHHIFHLHAHQWLHSPNSDNSTYLDSQAIGPGAGFTYEITYDGSSNRNKTPGDAIFHCHFYPHFAQGMWALWRVHDVFESGTVLDAAGRPAAGSRKLPDGEIAAGTPIPGLVPMPTYALAPMPTSTQPGFPFFIPGVAGHRPPTPPLDTEFDGGLHRHVVRDGVAQFPALNRLDFSKHDVTLVVDTLPETGTVLEKNAMAYHARRSQPTYRFDPVSFAVVADTFITNGRPGAKGAPYADPCVDDFGRAVGVARTYKGASIQIDAKYNKAGWNYPQHRMFSLWQDVDSFRLGVRPPEPMFIRANTNDCVSYHLVNLVPKEYNLDDFQVRTPTDVIGQHIHLVKFDVTASDGAANGFNYEDGAMSPGEVRARIQAIRKQYGCVGVSSGDPRDGTWPCPVARAHPFFGAGPNGEWLGAQENIQRWYVDDVKNAAGVDRTLRTVFTHDHFGPSTHQQTGLYAGLVVEPKNSQWRDPETGVYFGTRTVDGGPTSWRADIIRTPADSSYREFNLQIADFALAYDAGRTTYPDPARAINPPGKFEPNPILPFMLRPPVARGLCPNLIDTPPCPELVSADDPGTMMVNYRNEPLALRVRNPATNTQAAGDAGDLSLAFASDITRADARFNAVGPYRPLTRDVRNGDPFTPLIRAYEDDKVQIRILTGAHEEGHNFSVHGTEWLFEPSDSASGYRNSQMMGISEHYEFVLPPLADNLDGNQADYLYSGGSATDDLWNGMWGIIRTYRNIRTDLKPLPQNTDAATAYSMAYQEASLSPMTYDKMMSPSAAFMETTAVDSTSWEGSADDPLVGPDSGYGSSTTTQTTSPTSGTATYQTEHMAAPVDAESQSEPTTTTQDPMLTTVDAKAMEQQTLQSSTAGGELSETDGQTVMMTSSDATMVEQEATLTDPYAYDAAYATKTSTSTTSFNGICPSNAPVRQFDVTAVQASRALPAGRLTYNSRTTNGGPLYDPSAIMYVYSADLTWNGLNWVLKSGVPIEPITLRANAGDCIQLTLRNRISGLSDPDGFNTLPMIVDRFNANQVDPSQIVGLHPQMLAVDVTRSDGSKVGFNPRTVVRPGKRITYQWYAGEVVLQNGVLNAFPVEYGATNLISSDRIKHPNKGAIGSLVIEPRGATWRTDATTRAQATVYRSDGTKMFREFVLQFQDDVNLRFGSTTTLPNGVGTSKTFAAGTAVPNLADAEDAEDSGQKAFNYRTEPLWHRLGFAPDAALEWTRDRDFRNSLKSSLAAPQTPTFTATVGEPVRFRVLQSGGHARNHVFNLHGHAWQEEPYNRNSRAIASNPLSEVKGAQFGHGPTNHFDVVPLNGAGGRNRIAGDYLYRDQSSFLFDGGLWGIFRVKPLIVKTYPVCCTLEPREPVLAEPMVSEPAMEQPVAQ